MSTVLKIDYEGTLRRLNLRVKDLDESFSNFEIKVRGLFNIPEGQLVITYKDKEGDLVTMGGDEDLKDACVLQGLNPLYLTVKLVSSGKAASSGSRTAGEGSVPSGGSFVKEAASIRELVDSTLQAIGSPTADAVKQFLPAYEPLLKGVGGSGVIEILELLLKSGKSRGESQSSTSSEDKKSVNVASSESASRQCPCPAPGLVPIVPVSEEGWRTQCPCPPPGLVPVPRPELLKMRPNIACGNDCSRDGSQPSNVQPCRPEAPDNYQVFHNGVQCDGCGICPIVGPRFKSLKKHDFDLCRRCFNDMGKEEEYERYDRPVGRSPHPYSGRHSRYPAFQGSGMFGSDRGCHPGSYFPRGPYGGKICSRYNGPGCGSNAGKPDARFVQDVSIFDGTELAPGTSFTKIWRLRNSGAIPWPSLTHLVHVGGDELGATSASPLELPQAGLAPEAEVDASVDLVAPEKPGRYISHWRLQAPTGQKFGHRMWVLIQVVPNGQQSPQLAASMVSGDDVKTSDEQICKAEAEPVSELVSENREIVSDPVVVAEQVEEVEKVEPICDEAAEAQQLKEPVTLASVPEVLDAPVSDSSELEGFSMVEIPSGNNMNGSDPASPHPAVSEKLGVSEVLHNAEVASEAPDLSTLLWKLEAMGFNQRKLNTDLLEKNEFDLQRTVDDLVAATEWDPILEELEEMGFFDAEMNRRLMFKNKGSVKRVVKELVQIYKAPDSKLKEQ